LLIFKCKVLGSEHDKNISFVHAKLMKRFQFFTLICREKMGSNLMIETARNSKCPKVSTVF